MCVPCVRAPLAHPSTSTPFLPGLSEASALDQSSQSRIRLAWAKAAQRHGEARQGAVRRRGEARHIVDHHPRATRPLELGSRRETAAPSLAVMEAAVEELSRGLSLASAREGASKDGEDASATSGNAGGMMKSAAAQRVEELERRKDAKKFDGMASSLFDALDAVPVRPKSLLEDSKDSTGATSSISRKDFGRGLSVIDQFALRVHSSHASSEATFNLDGTARTKATSGSLAFTAGDTGLGSGLALSSKKKKQPNLSRKARQRKEKSRQRGQAYSERASGPSKRGRARGKSSRLQLL